MDPAFAGEEVSDAAGLDATRHNARELTREVGEFARFAGGAIERLGHDVLAGRGGLYVEDATPTFPVSE